MVAPKYSICITHYNNRSTIEKSLESIFDQIDESFELIVVDNLSVDGSQTILKDYAERNMLKLVRKKCSRGMGRQTALENARGRYVVANMDMDDTFVPRLIELLNYYHKCCEDKLLWVRSVDPNGFWGGENFTIVSKEVVVDLGGWHDLQFGEDFELASRAARRDLYVWSDFNLLAETNAHKERRSTFGKLKFRFVRYRDLLRCGRRIFDKNEKVSWTQRLLYFAAKISLPFYESYGSDFAARFDPYDKKYRIDLV